MQLNTGKRRNFSLNSAKHIAICFVISFLTVFIISSCKKKSGPEINVTAFQLDIEDATTVPDLTTASQLTRDVLQPLGAASGTPLVKRYVTETGGGSRDGTSWATAWAAVNLRSAITNITDATASKVYLVMVAGGTYKPDYSTTAGTTERAISFSLNNRVAIMGGFDPAGGWGRTGTTMFSGDIGTVGTTTDNSYHVFNNSGTLNNAHLYGVTITNGNANGVNPQHRGGGMYNSSSSPVLTKVIFSGNTANFGGGMYNFSSSPVLTEVVFSGNTASSSGGGMNNNGASPVLTRVVFSGNTATGDGGGMFNTLRSFPVLTSVVFSGNTATGDGGGMYNSSSTPIMIGLVFRNNTAANGGAMLNNNNGQAGGPFIVNTIFSDNTLSGAGRGTNIAVDLSGAGAENIRIAGSVLGIGLAQPTNDIVGYSSGGRSATLNISYHSLTNTAVRFGADATTGLLTYPTIQSGSSAINLGLYARRRIGGNYYFSDDNMNWYIGFATTGGWGTAENLPANTEDLAATDIAGNPRNARPDAGVYEVR